VKLLLGAAGLVVALIAGVATSLTGAVAQGPDTVLSVTMAAAARGELVPATSCTSGQVISPASTGAPASAGAAVAARAAYAAGWRGPLLTQAVAIAGAESTWNPAAVTAPAGGNYGLWQINTVHQDLLTSGDWRDPGANARMAHAVWAAAGGSWKPWEAYTNGAYQRFMGPAGDAVQGLQVDTTDETAVADLGGEPCQPGAGGATGAETAPVSQDCATGGSAEGTAQGEIHVCQVGPLTVNVTWAPNIAAMLADARAAGLDIGGSGWRSFTRQGQLYAQNCHGGSCSPPTAKPGTSRHEQGLAVDLTCGGQLIRSRTSPCYQFLAASGGGFGTARGTVNRWGMRNLDSGAEAWHWSDNGH
jgi:hypothetical protein